VWFTVCDALLPKVPVTDCPSPKFQVPPHAPSRSYVPVGLKATGTPTVALKDGRAGDEKAATGGVFARPTGTLTLVSVKVIRRLREW
jgi:hypothetical protein